MGHPGSGERSGQPDRYRINCFAGVTISVYVRPVRGPCPLRSQGSSRQLTCVPLRQRGPAPSRLQYWKSALGRPQRHSYAAGSSICVSGQLLSVSPRFRYGTGALHLGAAATLAVASHKLPDFTCGGVSTPSILKVVRYHHAAQRRHRLCRANCSGNVSTRERLPRTRASPRPSRAYFWPGHCGRYFGDLR